MLTIKMCENGQNKWISKEKIKKQLFNKRENERKEKCRRKKKME